MIVKKEATQVSKKKSATQKIEKAVEQKIEKAVEQKIEKAVEQKIEKAVEQKIEKAVEQKKEAVREVKQLSNTQKCANMIIQLATDAKHTRQEIVQTVSDALTALSVVTVKTMLSDLHNAKYAKRYSATTIKTDRETKRVSLDKAIV